MIKTEYTIIAPFNFTIALVTDLHEYNPEAVLKILKEVKPDVIAIAGDTLERQIQRPFRDGGIHVKWLW